MSIRVAVYTCTECKLRSLRLRRETVRLVECRLFYTTRTLKKSAGQVENKDDGTFVCRVCAILFTAMRT